MNDRNDDFFVIPQLSRRCRWLVYLLHALFIALPVAAGLWVGNAFGWLYGFFAWLAAAFAGMIVISKIKLHYVPLEQHELPHATQAILRWWVFRRFCG
ncbi:hypothetical protein [Hydrogenimonas sp.]